MTDPIDEVLESQKSQALIADSFRRLRETEMQRRDAAELGRPALVRLVEVMRARTGQSYKVRSFLWSLYNGKPASLLEALGLDWTIRKDLGLVFLGYGYDGSAHAPEFFYDAIKEAVGIAGLWGWFTLEGDGTQGGPRE